MRQQKILFSSLKKISKKKDQDSRVRDSINQFLRLLLMSRWLGFIEKSGWDREVLTKRRLHNENV
jgi:hypothetical protein